MKKIFYILALVAAASMVSCDQELLNTEPSSELSQDNVLSDAGGAQMAISGIYRAMRVNSWSNGWEHEHPGIFAQILVFDLMGEDHFMASQGNGWFYFDHKYNVDTDYTHTASRQYGTWKLGYTMVAQANFVIAAKEVLEATPEGLNVLGQAYAIRAYSYWFLAECFCQGNVAENKETCPGVPIYTEPTTKDTKGKGRGLLKDVYTQINLDYEAAITCFEAAEKAGVGQQDVSHIDLYAAKLLWARAALAEGEWQRAYDLATEALAKPGLSPVVSVKELGGFNDVNVGSILWGFNVTADQTSPFGNFHSHMDPFDGSYGSAAPQCWCPLLAESIPETDDRVNWLYDYKGKYYFQNKFLIGDVSTSVSDNIILRGEEAVLVAAEAACHLKNYTEAKKYISMLGEARDSKYAERLAAVEDSELYNDDTTAALQPRTLMDEILWQRRVELWSEGPGRLSDLKRLNLGFLRYSDEYEFSAGAYEFTMLIPYTEFQNNTELSLSKDQNPR